MHIEYGDDTLEKKAGQWMVTQSGQMKSAERFSACCILFELLKQSLLGNVFAAERL